jgi:hypothetical protein
MTHDPFDLEPTTGSRTLRAKVPAAIASIVLLGSLALAAQRADAAQYIIESGSPLYMRGFVSTPTPLYSCGQGYLGVGSIVARAPASFGTLTAYETVFVYQLDSTNHWQVYNRGSPAPNGKSVGPGCSVSFPAFSVPGPAASYYAYAQIDFHIPGRPTLGKVDIKPTVAGDWSSAYRYVGDGYSYCFHYQRWADLRRAAGIHADPGGDVPSSPTRVAGYHRESSPTKGVACRSGRPGPPSATSVRPFPTGSRCAGATSATT